MLFLFNIVLEVLATAKEKKGIQIIREEIKLPLVDDTIL